MLADRCSMKDVVKAMKDKDFYIETKYDGERMQLHKEGSKFKFYSRNGFDFTEVYITRTTVDGNDIAFMQAM